jgi:hypothetical protein
LARPVAHLAEITAEVTAGALKCSEWSGSGLGSAVSVYELSPRQP